MMTPPVHPFARALRLEFDRRWSPASVRPPLLPASWPPPTDAELEARAATTRTWSRERPVLQLPPALPFHRPIDDDPTYKALLDSMTRSIEDDPDPLVHNADGSVTMPHPISAPTKRRQMSDEARANMRAGQLRRHANARAAKASAETREQIELAAAIHEIAATQDSVSAPGLYASDVDELSEQQTSAQSSPLDTCQCGHLRASHMTLCLDGPKRKRCSCSAFVLATAHT